MANISLHIADNLNESIDASVNKKYMLDNFNKPPQKKGMTYDDILLAMNMYVKDGKLQYLNQQNVKIDAQGTLQLTLEPRPTKQVAIQSMYSNGTINKTIDINKTTVNNNPTVNNNNPARVVSLANIKEEYRTKLLNEIARIRRIKSKRLFLYDANMINRHSSREKNTLFKFIGRR